jgi:histidyl-tRNA synthetase
VSGKFQAPRGTHDVLPADANWWHLVRTMEEVAALYGWGRIQTPGFEDTGLFARTSGEASDVVHKEMYTFFDRGKRPLTLRPEGTAPIARAYVQHGLHRGPQPLKAYTIAPMYRYGAPGRGRHREHYQLSVEAIGSADPAIDAEVIQLYTELLARLGVTQWELHLNSIGDADCRPAYVQRLNHWLDEHDDLLDDEARHKRATSPLQVFDVKNPDVRSALQGAPKIGESLCRPCLEHFEQVRGMLDASEVPYIVDSALVRGLDYYTRTTFEFIGPDENANSTICGGGRYDGLVEAIGGPPTPGVGFGAGLERLALALENEKLSVDRPSIDAFFAFDNQVSVDDPHRETVFAQMAKVRSAGISCDAGYSGRSLKNQVEQAARLRAKFVVIVWPLGAGGVTIRRHGRDEWPVPVDQIAETLINELK